ncbi:MAG TPA: STAS domain-containing protein [bacterium]|nr:STAS domain-containing protein [bacterium]HQG45870.1 STAS domain-containing protein [bacterium]HQI48801.1 STAS domain-containing protein [bacterium]HQJ66053.1 STAS domain-containing protein [bacterium]
MENFKVVRQDGVDLTTLKIIGFLDAHTAPMLEEAIQKLIDDQKVNILVDFKELNYISSAGLGVFMGFIEEVRSRNGDIKMCSMSPKIYRVFDLLGFPTIYQIFDKQDEAAAMFLKDSAAASDE